MKNCRIITSLLFSIIIIFSSCKKTDANLPLKGVDADNTNSSGSFGTKKQLGTTSYMINDISVKNSDIYLVGNFSSFAGISSHGIIVFHETSQTFSKYYSNLNTCSVRSFLSTSSEDYIGGNFTYSSGGTTAYIASKSYTSSTFNTVGGTLNGDVRVMKQDGSNVYYAGNFYYLNGSYCSRLLYQNNGIGYQFGTSLYSNYDYVYDIEKFGSNWYIGGSISSGNILYSLGGSWTRVGNGFDGHVNDLEVFNNNLYAAGNMTSDYLYSNSPMNYVNKLNGYNWGKVGSNNLPDGCNDIEMNNGIIYACGNGYLYYLDTDSNTWKNKLANTLTVGDLKKIRFVNGRLYAIEVSGGNYNFISIY